tara:strand:- start:136 stop:1065 length:930 start_codon:yes stop_codon:yes gene_type:complete
MSQSKNYLITGITGFVGNNILKKLINKKNIKIYYTYRNKDLSFKKANLIGKKVNFENLDEINKLKNILKNIDTIIHCANLAHSNYTEKKITKVNYFATVHLANLAKIFKVKKFIFLSTAKINMNYNKNISRENDISQLTKNDLYTNIKYKTEIKIFSIFKHSKVDCIILRPALIYGKNLKGNLNKLKVLSKFFLPLPFLNAIEKKSFCSIHNLIKVIEIILRNKIKSNVFIVCDDIYYSLKDILIQIYKKDNKKVILFPIKLTIFKFLFSLVNKKNVYDSIFSKMILDNSNVKKSLNISFSRNFYNTKY